MLDQKKTFLELRSATLTNIEIAHDQLDFMEVMDSLLYSSEQIRIYAIESEDENEKDCALNNLQSIVAVVKYIGQVNDLILRSNLELKGGESC